MKWEREGVLSLKEDPQMPAKYISSTYSQWEAHTHNCW